MIELLVVIAIIGLLSTFSVISTIRARNLANVNKAAADVGIYLTAISLLGDDTGKWPNGCPVEGSANPEVRLDAVQAGLVSEPAIGDQGDGCFWSASDLEKWNGPYAQVVDDPWGNPYWFDPDFRGYDNCASKTSFPEDAAVLSFGPNGQGLNVYDCDDIFKLLP